MYNEVPFDAENHLMCLWDAGLNTRTNLAARSQALLMKEWRVNGYVHENYNAITGESCDIASSVRYYHWDALLGLTSL